MFKKICALTLLALGSYIHPLSVENTVAKDIPLVGNYGSYGIGEDEGILFNNLDRTDSFELDIDNELDPDPAYLNAHELRLKVREIASQLLESWNPQNLKGMVAYITTFTPQDDMRGATDLGQYMRQALMYEFNQRGFAVRDFSARDYIVNEDGYAYGISDNKYKTSVLKKNAALVTGTFYKDKEHLFINARLIRGSDGMVLRTAQTIMPVTPIVERTTKVKPKPLKPLLPSATLKIVPGE